MVRVVGRDALLGEVIERLRQGESVALHGPAGVGKSAILDTLETRIRSDRDVAVLRAKGAPDERALPYATLRDLISQVPREVTQTLPEGLRHYAEDGLARLVGLATTDEVRARASVRSSTLSWTRGEQREPVLILLDDVHCSTPILGAARLRPAAAGRRGRAGRHRGPGVVRGST